MHSQLASGPGGSRARWSWENPKYQIPGVKNTFPWFSSSSPWAAQWNTLSQGPGASPGHSVERGVSLWWPVSSSSPHCPHSQPYVSAPGLKEGQWTADEMCFPCQSNVLRLRRRKKQQHTIADTMVIIPISHQAAGCPTESRGKGRWIATFPVALTLITPPPSAEIQSLD